MEDLLALIRKQFLDKFLDGKNKIDLFEDYSDFTKTFETSYKKVVELHSSSKPQKPSGEVIKEADENTRSLENIQPPSQGVISINEIRNDESKETPTPQDPNIPSLRVSNNNNNNDMKKQPKKPMRNCFFKVPTLAIQSKTIDLRTY
jgi:hypothetical protein